MQFTLNDLADEIQQIRKLQGTCGILRQLLPDGTTLDVDINRDLRRVLAIIGSMTNDEREYPEQIHPNRARRIACGSGTDRADVDEFLRQFLGVRRFFEQQRKGSN